MSLTAENKREIFKKFGEKDMNTGSTEGQKDFNTERSLIRLVGKRRSLLDYLKGKDIEKYRALIKELNIRK